MRIEALNHKIEEDKNQIITMLGERATIKSKMSSFDTMMEQLRIRKAELNSRLLRARSDEAERDAEIQSLQEAFQRITDEISETAAHLAQMESTTRHFGTGCARKTRKSRKAKAHTSGINHNWIQSQISQSGMRAMETVYRRSWSSESTIKELSVLSQILSR